MKRWRVAWPALAVALAVACDDGGVRTESAVTATSVVATASPPMSTPPTTAPPSTPPTTSAPATSAPATTAATSVPAEPSPSIGDTLFPELGSRDLDVQSYDVRLAYDVATATIDATVVITTLVERPLPAIALDATGLDVLAATVDGVEAAIDHDSPELLVRPPTPLTPGEPAVVEIRYRDGDHTVGPGPFGLGAGWFTVDGGAYVLNEPDGARQWLPSNDHPSDKATWRFELTVADGLAAVANGRLVEQRPGAGTTTWVWEQPDPMATYLVQVLIGDYVVLDGGVAGGVPLTNVALRDDARRMQPYFDVTDDQLAFFEQWFGPYPLDGYGLAFAPSIPGLAMETQGRSMFSRVDFGGALDLTAHLLLAHELAHQWFGNAVTPADWGDLWLNEAFATYAEWMWLDHVGLQSLDGVAARTLAERQRPGEATATPTVDNLFGFERYAGGAVVVHALRREIGDEAFFGLLRRWVAELDGRSATTEELTTRAAEAAGRDLSAFFAAWLYAEQLPPSYPG